MYWSPTQVIPFQNFRLSSFVIAGVDTQVAQSRTDRVGLIFSANPLTGGPLRVWPQGGSATMNIAQSGDMRPLEFLFSDWGVLVTVPWFANSGIGFTLTVIELFYRPVQAGGG